MSSDSRSATLTPLVERSAKEDTKGYRQPREQRHERALTEVYGFKYLLLSFPFFLFPLHSVFCAGDELRGLGGMGDKGRVLPPSRVLLSPVINL